MVQCDNCDDHFHLECIGMTKEIAESEDYVCGYCCAEEDKDGNVMWEGEIPIPNGRVRRPKAKVRNIAAFKDKMARYARDEEEFKGPQNWEELLQELSAHSKKMHEKKLKKYEAAKVRLESRDHHLTDMQVGGRLEAAALNDEAIDFLQGAGELD